MKYHTLFFWKIKKDVTKCVVCCSGDWRFKGLLSLIKTCILFFDAADNLTLKAPVMTTTADDKFCDLNV